MQQSQESNRTILLKLLLCFVVYYAVAFAFAGLLVGIFDLRFQGTLPFEFDIDFKTPRSTAAWLCLVLPQVAEGFFIGIAYHHQPRQWDYIVTMALCHLILSCLVLQQGPTQWPWFVTFIVCQPVVWFLAQAMATCFKPARVQQTEDV
eukprot:m.2353 g.2353  ORF g.2353 m.2353 type:complete len:148 (+) comp3354_c0_seq2:75-518(+)